MKFSITPFFALLAFTFLALFSCGKNDDKSPTEKLTGASCWEQIKDEVYNNATSQWEDAPLDDCAKDDCRVFNADNTTTLDAGAVKCASEPQIVVGTWDLSVDEKTLLLGENGVELSATIVELTESRLVLENQFFTLKNRITFQAK